MLKALKGDLTGKHSIRINDQWRVVFRWTDAAARLAEFDREVTEQEWLSDLHDHQTVFEKYRHAIGCYFAAPEMRRYALEEFSAQAPGLVWKQRRESIMEARWQSPSEAVEAGWKVKSVKLGSWTGDRNNLTAEDKEFIISTTRALQAELDEWLSNEAGAAILVSKGATPEEAREQ